jgi:uncharacterized repeat protein (TIGR02543 family)
LAYGNWGFYGYFYVRTDENLDYVPELEDTEYSTFLGWYYVDTDEPFDITKPITEDIEIYAKWESSASNKLDDLLKLIPIGTIATIFIVLSVVEIKRMLNARGKRK